ncbi:phosphodiesterase [Allosphingosinicella sp.]|jgi:3',5'-cyclic AMP phosphodiesterase CpdA|uniref:phosphodiesterase n=1 Tax=Allosphingosinicella sp. TaxID=2823234 RepID=UPI002F25855B
MLIAQITDIHLGFDQADPDELNRRRLDRALRSLVELSPAPDLLLITGDLAEAGDDRISYRRLKEAIAGLPFPVWMAMGNHDSRGPFFETFPEAPSADGFVQYAIDDWPLRILVLDTLEDGRHGGNFCETRAAWLGARLAEAPDRPTLIVLHHPPIETGLSWMTENPDAEWVERLRSIVAGQDNIVAMIAGHLHRPIVTRWAGTILAVCPSTAPQVALDLEPIDPERPDGRPMIVADHPCYALHWWNGRELISHFDTAEDHEVLASYGPALQPLVRMLMEEKKRPS